MIFFTLVKLIAIQCFTFYAYTVLNYPEVFESVGHLSIMIVGIVACTGTVIGNVFFENIQRKQVFKTSFANDIVY